MRFTSLLLLPSLLLLCACGDDPKPAATEEPDAAASDEPEELTEQQKKLVEGLAKATEGMGANDLSGMPVVLQSKLVSVDAEDAADLAVRAKHVGDTFHVDRFTGSVIEVTFAGDPPTRIPQANIAKDS